MYNCPADYDDGLAIEFRSENFEISECISQINRAGFHYDIILVDPWHQYSTSIRDLKAAFDLIEEGGILVVHDCLPDDEKLVTPEFIPGEWCGVTYKAYLDFVAGRHDLEYYTVETDYGCGIVRKLGQPWWRGLVPELCRSRVKLSKCPLLWDQWHENGDDFPRAYRFLKENKKDLLNLISVDEFFASLDSSRPGGRKI
jgi:hypothetical protein